jgi:hypothetical protein
MKPKFENFQTDKHKKFFSNLPKEIKLFDGCYAYIHKAVIDWSVLNACQPRELTASETFMFKYAMIHPSGYDCVSKICKDETCVSIYDAGRIIKGSFLAFMISFGGKALLLLLFDIIGSQDDSTVQFNFVEKNDKFAINIESGMTPEFLIKAALYKEWFSRHLNRFVYATSALNIEFKVKVTTIQSV